MGAESQLMDFVFGLQTKQFDKGVDKMVAGFKEIDKNATTLFGKGIAKAAGVASAGMQMLTGVIKDSLSMYTEHLKAMEQYRRESGLSTKEIGEFSQQVVASAAKYGVALGRVSSMAMFINKGMGRAGKGVAKLAAALGDLGDTTGLTDETAQELGFVLTRQFGMPVQDATKRAYVLAEQAKELNIPFEDMAALLANNKEALRALPIKESTKQFSAMGASLIKNGATVEQVNEFMGQFGDTSSRAYKVFIGQGSDVGKTMTTIGKRVTELSSQYKSGMITHSQYEVNMAKLESAFNVNRFTLEKMAVAQKDYAKSIKASDEADGLSLSELEDRNKKRLSAFGKFGKRLEFLKAGFGKWFNDLYGPDAPIWGWLDGMIDSVENLAGSVADFFAAFKSHITEGIKLWSQFLAGFEAADLLDPFHSEKGRAKEADVMGSGTKEEKIAWFNRQFKTKAALMRTKGVDTTQWEADRAKDIAAMAQKEGVSSSALSEMGGPAALAAQQLLASQETNTKLDKLINVTSEQVRQGNMNKLSQSSTPPTSRVGEATKTVIK